MIKFVKQKENLLIVTVLTILFFITVDINAKHLGNLCDEHPENFFIAECSPDPLKAFAKSNQGSVTTGEINSVGGDIFSSFYFGLGEWLHGGYVNGGYPNYQDGMFQKIADAIKTPFEVGLKIAILLIGLSSYLDVYTKHIRKLIKFVFATVILVSFLDWNTFAYWIFDPLLGTLIGFMQLLLPSSGAGLTDSIFGVDEHFSNLFNIIENYGSRMELNQTWWQTNITKTIVMYLILAMFAVLYAIFTILIIIGFFGFMMMTAFAPVFMAIGVFHKAMLLSWIKVMFNFFLIPIMTAAVMSITISFIGTAADAISNMSLNDPIFTMEIGTVFLVGIFSIGLHWKAPEFAAGISGGMVSGAGSIVGTAAAVGGGAWALSKSPLGGARNMTNTISGARGGSLGNQNTGAYRGGQAIQALFDYKRAGGVK